MRMLKIAALAAASFGLALSAHAQAPKQGQQMCQQIWSKSDTQKRGFVTGQQAMRLSQAIRTAQATPGTSGKRGATGGAGGGTTQGMPKSGSAGGGMQGQRVTQQEFMSACQRNPQAFQHLRS